VSLNILFLSTENPYPPDHGHHMRTFHVLKHLAERNRVFFLAFAKSQRELAHRDQLEKWCVSVDVIRLAEADQPWRIYLSTLWNLGQRDPFIVTRYKSAAARQRIRALLDRNQIDVVHFDLPHLASYAEHVGGIPKILVHHNVESLRMLRRAGTESNRLKKLYFHHQYRKLAALESRICPKFDRCVAVSDVDRDELQRQSHGSTFAVVPNGVDTDYFRPQRAKQELQGIVWTGGMGSPYNADAVDYFLTAIAPVILQEKPDLPMVFVGERPTKLLLKHAASHSNIFATGYVDDVRPYVERAAVFIAPLRSGSGTKLKILNAMAQGKAVVTTTIGAEGIEAVPDKDFIIADEPADFARRVLQFVRDPAAAAAMGRNSRCLVERLYDWRVIANDMCGLYDEIAAGKVRNSIYAGNN